jgi:hypothetical protein
MKTASLLLLLPLRRRRRRRRRAVAALPTQLPRCCRCRGARTCCLSALLKGVAKQPVNSFTITAAL